MSDIPLGKTDSYQNNEDLVYSPDLLFPIPRDENRRALGIDSGDLPFSGWDRWNAFEFSWLDSKSMPQAAKLCIDIPCGSVNIVESKSLKLYLNSLSFTNFDNEHALLDLLQRDLNLIIQAPSHTPLKLTLHSIESLTNESFCKSEVMGKCLDTLNLFTKSSPALNFDTVSPSVLELVTDAKNYENHSETIHSHLFRSLCPVTGQPDWASIVITYEGLSISHESVLRYLLSFRKHQGFHEDCVERIFADITAVCAPEKLSVYAAFLRRGGIDINPFRSNFEQSIPFGRLARQ